MENNLKKIAEEIGDLLAVKNKAYGSSTSMTFEIFGMEAYLVRMYDKINRATNLVKNNAECNDESLEDTLRDLAGYAILAVNELQNKKPRKMQPIEPLISEKTPRSLGFGVVVPVEEK